MGRHSIPELPLPRPAVMPDLASTVMPTHLLTPQVDPIRPLSAPGIPGPRRPIHSGGLRVVSRTTGTAGQLRTPTGPAAPEPRLLARPADGSPPARLATHLRVHGPLPRAELLGRKGAGRLIQAAELAGLRGRGGAGFPTGVKMAAVCKAGHPKRPPVVVANGCEGDPTSGKDRLLLRVAPHLVLDGIALAVHAVGADEATLCVHRGDPLVEHLERAIAERTEDPVRVRVVAVPARYVSSESSALVNFLTSGDARPTAGPPRPSEQGVHGRPTLVDNVETLAHLALIARHGPDWFRARGTDESPGTTLVTIGGVVRGPGVYEIDLGTPIGRVLPLAGGTSVSAQALLLGGVGGSWLPMPSAVDLELSHEGCAAGGSGMGVASLVALPDTACGVRATALMIRHLAGESAGQCGPCMLELPAIADDLDAAAVGRMDRELGDRLYRRLQVIPGRGACAHPDGAVRMASSALEVFRRDLTNHFYGRPCRAPDTAIPPVLADLRAAAEGSWW
jgi:NADH:ubiquinone oxidoreductase subunit F (NADH-binding)